MKKILSILLCAVVTNAMAQNYKSEKRIKKLKVTDVFLQQLFGSAPSTQATLANFISMAPNSSILKSDFAGFSSNTGYYGTNLTGFNPSIGIQFANKNQTDYRANPLLRLGLNLSSGNALGLGYSKQEKYRIDTLTSSQTGGQIFIDSNVYKGYSMSYTYKTVGADVALLFRTNPKARWSIYGGVGANVGFALNSQININKYVGNAGYSNALGNYVNYNFSSGYESVYETYEVKNNTAHSASVYLPFGIDFRIGNRREFFKRIHLFVETRPSLSYLSIKNIYSNTDITNVAATGLRVNWR